MSDSCPSTPTENHYDKRYFEEHYGGLLSDDSYYCLLSQYWKKAVFTPLSQLNVLPDARVLDYGAGTGVVTAALRHSACYDVAEYSRVLLRKRGREVFDRVTDIPHGAFDGVLCSHSLEHYEDPKRVLETFTRYVRSGGFLVLILPVDDDFSPTIESDENQHLYCWNFQAISNLLRICGWRPFFGVTVFGPCLLRTLGRVLPAGAAVDCAHAAGRLKRGFRSMLVAAQLHS